MFVGIDVAKAELVVAVHPSGARWTVTNDERGGYELLAVAALAAAALPVVVVNPRQARDFARATGQLKTVAHARTASAYAATAQQWHAVPPITNRCHTKCRYFNRSRT